MTVHTMKILTDDVSASLIRVANIAPEPDRVSLDHVSVAFVAMIENGSCAAGDGMMRITEIE